MLSKGGRILLRPFHQLLCQPLWSGLIKWRLSSCSPSHNRLWCEAHIITMTGWLPISALLLSWENAPHSSPAGGKNLSGLSVILSRPEIAVNHHPSFHCGRNLSGTCHLCTSPPIPKILTSRRAHPVNINWNNEISTWRNTSANLCSQVLWVEFKVVAWVELCLGKTALRALLLRQQEHVPSIILKLQACVCFRKKSLWW